jgi:hypothetical protein
MNLLYFVKSGEFLDNSLNCLLLKKNLLILLVSQSFSQAGRQTFSQLASVRKIVFLSWPCYISGCFPNAEKI